MAYVPRLAGISCVFMLLALSDGALAAPPAVGAMDGLRQVAGILDYIGGDYRGAVGPDGQLLDAGEYEEQRSLAREADTLAAQAGLRPDDGLRVRLGELAKALDAKRTPQAVDQLCRAARQAIVVQHGVTLGPAAAPSRADGARLYTKHGCATCHGVDGGANTDAARKLNPRPANFLDPVRVAAVSPHRAFYALSFGVAGTAMLPVLQLSEAQRWSLAFYVLSLRHEAADLHAGKRFFDDAATALTPSAAVLAALTDEDLLARLHALPAKQRTSALAYLRGQAPFAEQAGSPTHSLALARQALRAGLAAYRKGDSASARRSFISAYLDGFEPHEAALSTRDRVLVKSIERAMLAVRESAGHGATAARVAVLVEQAEGLLTRAERGRGDGTTAMWGAITIALREGLEISLLITALLGLVRRRGQASLVRFVHAGWTVAVVLGIATWWVVGEAMSGLARELAEGIATLIAAALLLGVTHWLFGQMTAKSFMGFLGSRMQQATSGKNAALGIFGLSFIAAYREMVEIVLFFKALLLDAGDAQQRVWLGAGIGVAALVVISFVLQRLGQRLPLRPFMLMSSVLLAVLCFALTGNGLHALQEAAVVSVTAVEFPELPLLGLHATREGLIAQGLLLLLLLASALGPLLGMRRRTEGQPHAP